MRRQGNKRKRSEDGENKTNMHLNWIIRSIIRKKNKKLEKNMMSVCVCVCVCINKKRKEKFNLLNVLNTRNTIFFLLFCF